MAKKISICTSGSRGDTQPYIALALELQKRGHEVKVCVEERMKDLVESFELPFHKIAGDPTALLWEKDAQEMLRDGKVMQLMKRTEEFNAPFFKQALKDYEEACDGADIIVTGPLCLNQTYCIAERNKVPWIPLLLLPTVSADFPVPFFKASSFGIKFLNKLSWNFIFLMMWSKEKEKINAWRVNHLKIPPITTWKGVVYRFEEGWPLLLGLNKAMLPYGKIPEDYPKNFNVTGFNFVPSVPVEEVDARIIKFVESSDGKPIVYLGFGSMPAPDPSVLLKLSLTVLKHCKVRIIICAGWSALEDLVNPGENNLVTSPDKPVSDSKISLPDDILLISHVSHDYLFPCCSVVVHHCGMGTSAATLKAGTPSVCCPVMLDQPYNATRLNQLGVAPLPIPFEKLNASNLIPALKQVLDTPSMKENAKLIADDIAKENGAQTSADIVENLTSPW